MNPTRRFPQKKRKQRLATQRAVPRDTARRVPYPGLPRQMGAANPLETRRLLKYQEAATFGPVAINGAIRWHTNCVNEFQPGGSDTPPGLTLLSSAYNYYRIIGYKIKLTIVNGAVTPTTMYFVNQVTDPSTTASGYQQLANNRHGHSTILGPLTSGAAKFVYSKKLSIAQVVGSNAPYTADSYRALVSGIPADQTWFGFAAFNPIGTNVSLTYQLNIDVDVIFYDMIPQLA